MKVRLFGVRLSPFVEKVARALQLKEIDYELVAPAGLGDFRRWNPATGKMPVLDIDGTRIYDSSRILRVLDLRVPEPRLFSNDPSTARKQAFIEDWADESLYWYAMAFRWTSANAIATTNQVLGTLPALVRPVARLFLPRRIASAAYAQGLVRLPLDVLTEELARRMDELVEWLGAKPYFFGDRPGGADLAVYGQMSGLRSGPTPQAARLIDQRKALADFYDRVDRETAPRRGRGRQAA